MSSATTPYRDLEKAPEMDRSARKDSYVGLAHQMSVNPDVLIFRRFGDLNAQNLLRLQAKVNILEDRLRDEEERLRKLHAAKVKMQKKEQNASDTGAADSQPFYLRDWERLEQDVKFGNDDAMSYVRLFDEVSLVLKEYSKFQNYNACVFLTITIAC